MQNQLNLKLDAYIDEQMKYLDLPSLAVSAGYVDPSGNVFSAEYAGSQCRDIFSYRSVRGYKDISDRESAQPENCYHMASVTKTMTGTAIMQLVEQGRLNLSDKVADLLPEVCIADKRYENVTLEHMLSHTSGIGDVEDYHWDKPRIDESALQDYVTSEEVRQSRMICTPGEKSTDSSAQYIYDPEKSEFHYSNIAYEMLGAIVAKYSGLSYEEYVKRFLLEPAGMKNSTLLTFERTGGRLDREAIKGSELVMPHAINEQNSMQVLEHFPYNREHGPSSTLTSNVEDIACWARAVFSCSVLTKETYEEMWRTRVQVPNNRELMGLTWFGRRQGGHTFYGHEGTDDGFRASFWLSPELGLYVACMSNVSGAPTKKILKGLTEVLLEK